MLLADEDLDAMTALLEIRHVAGDEALTNELRVKAHDLAVKRQGRVLRELADGAELRERLARRAAVQLSAVVVAQCSASPRPRDLHARQLVRGVELAPDALRKPQALQRAGSITDEQVDARAGARSNRGEHRRLEGCGRRRNLVARDARLRCGARRNQDVDQGR